MVGTLGRQCSGGPTSTTLSPLCFFFQAEDGIRDLIVTGVQTCALPISVVLGAATQLTATPKDAVGNVLTGRAVTWASSNAAIATVSATGLVTGVAAGEIGRASCRERVEISVVGVSLKTKEED